MKPKIFYGWWIVLAMFYGLLVHSGAVFYVFGVFYEPLLNRFGWSRTEVAGGLTIYLLTVAFTSPLVGKLTDRFGPKRVVWIGALLGSIAFMLLTQIRSLWHFYFLYFVIGLGFSACGVVPVSTAITNWFVRRRGTAIGIVMAGVSVGAVTITPAGGFMMAKFGFTMTYLFLASIALLVIPIVILLVKNTPQEMGLLPDGETSINNAKNNNNTPNPDSAAQQEDPAEDGEGWTLGAAIKTQTLWFTTLSFCLIGIAIGAVLGHQIVFITDLGLPLTTAAMALGITGGMGGLGKIVFGFFTDKFSPKYIAGVCFAMMGIGIILLLFAKSMVILWIYVFFFGFSMGGQIALQPLIVGRFFGLKSFGTIYGIVAMSAALGTSIGPLLAGAVFDVFKTYYGVFSGCILLCFAASFLIFKVKRPVQK